jgi:hypothetical protein
MQIEKVFHPVAFLRISFVEPKADAAARREVRQLDRPGLGQAGLHQPSGKHAARL